MIIAVDYDGTLANTNAQKKQWIKERLGLDVPPYQCNHTDCASIIGEQAYRTMARHVYDRKATLRAQPVPGSEAALQKMASAAAVHVVTARSSRQLEFARQWLWNARLMDCVKDMHSSEAKSKAEIYAAIGAEVLIDDDDRHLQNNNHGRLRRILLRITEQDGEVSQVNKDSAPIVCTSWREILCSLKLL